MIGSSYIELYGRLKYIQSKSQEVKGDRQNKLRKFIHNACFSFVPYMRHSLEIVYQTTQRIIPSLLSTQKKKTSLLFYRMKAASLKQTIHVVNNQDFQNKLTL